MLVFMLTSIYENVFDNFGLIKKNKRQDQISKLAKNIHEFCDRFENEKFCSASGTLDGNLIYEVLYGYHCLVLRLFGFMSKINDTKLKNQFCNINIAPNTNDVLGFINKDNKWIFNPIELYDEVTSCRVWLEHILEIKSDLDSVLTDDIYNAANRLSKIEFSPIIASYVMEKRRLPWKKNYFKC